MTLTDAETRVRHLLNQTDTANTLYDDTNLIDKKLNEARRLIVSIVNERYLTNIRKRSSLTVTSNVAAMPTDFLRHVENPYVTFNTSTGVPENIATRIMPSEKWRIKFLQDQETAKPSTYSCFFYEESDGIHIIPGGSVTELSYEYFKGPAALDATDNKDLQVMFDDLTVNYAFAGCLSTTRGDKTLAGEVMKTFYEKIRAYR